MSSRLSSRGRLSPAGRPVSAQRTPKDPGLRGSPVHMSEHPSATRDEVPVRTPVERPSRSGARRKMWWTDTQRPWTSENEIDKLDVVGEQERLIARELTRIGTPMGTPPQPLRPRATRAEAPTGSEEQQPAFPPAPDGVPGVPGSPYLDPWDDAQSPPSPVHFTERDAGPLHVTLPKPLQSGPPGSRPTKKSLARGSSRPSGKKPLQLEDFAPMSAKHAD